MTTCKLMLKVLPPLVLIVLMVSTVYAAPPTQLWSDPVGTNDIALSKDGNYVAIAAGNELRFYRRSIGTPMWTCPALLGGGNFYSVEISDDGDCVAVIGGSGGGAYVAFWKGARSMTGTFNPDWISIDYLYYPATRRCLAISDDGGFLVSAGGSGSIGYVYYWGNAKGIGSGSMNVPPTWQYDLGSNIRAVDISSDGDFAAVGFGTDVAYWKGAKSLTGNPAPAWKSTKPEAEVEDIVISDDGNYVAAATGSTLSVHYWANAKSLTGDPDHTWYYGSGMYFSSIDMSSDGNSVIAGSSGGVPVNIAPQKGDTSKAALGGVTGGAVYFWSGAKGLTGKPQNPTWTYTTEANIHDVAIDDVGTYMAADANILIPGAVYFFNSGGTLLWNYPIDLADKVSISGDGATLAVGTSAATTGYLLSTGFSSGNPPNPVGGVVLPTNKLEIVAPFAALAGLIVAISAVVVVKRRRD